MHGAANRHIAVKSARSDRIFYSDDDDLLLAQHIEVLGSALDNADVVDTPAVSVLFSGQVALGVRDSRHSVIRQMLIDERYKGVFDTHLAHRKSVYNNTAGAWLQAKDPRVVLHMLKHFASDPRIVWKTEQRVTALSFHGASRLGMPGQERAAELARWHAKMANLVLEKDIRCSGSYAFYAFKLFRALQGILGNTISETVMAELRKQVADQLSGRQAGVLRATVSLLTGSKPEEDTAPQVLDDLLDMRLSTSFPTKDVVAIFLSVLPPEEVDLLLKACRPRPSVVLAKFHVRARRRMLSEEMIEAVTAGHERLPSLGTILFRSVDRTGFSAGREIRHGVGMVREAFAERPKFGACVSLLAFTGERGRPYRPAS